MGLQAVVIRSRLLMYLLLAITGVKVTMCVIIGHGHKSRLPLNQSSVCTEWAPFYYR